MDEARRFLRYVIPGTLFLVETTLLLWILFPDWAECAMKSVAKDSGFALVVGALLGSGGLGFMFSTTHHGLLWRSGRPTNRCGGGLDFRGAVTRMRAGDALIVVDSAAPSAAAPALTPFDAWVVVTALWHQRVKSNQRIGSADTRATSLSDLAHGMGAARIATLCALPAAVVIARRVGRASCEPHAVCCGFVMVVVWAALVGLHHLSYRRTSLAVVGVVEQILRDALVDERGDTGRIPRTHVCTDAMRGA